jgi:hypothetical protein
LDTQELVKAWRKKQKFVECKRGAKITEDACETYQLAAWGRYAEDEVTRDRLSSFIKLNILCDGCPHELGLHPSSPGKLIEQVMTRGDRWTA